MVLGRIEAMEYVNRVRGRGLSIVFTNGVFDLLHPGHVRYLRDARALGDVLIVAINSDESVRALGKGNDRPINSETDRAEVIAALDGVDAVVIFDERTPHDIVSALQPDILVKGADWPDGAIIGADVVEARGGRIVRLPFADGYSTSKLIDKIRNPSKSATITTDY